MEINPAYITAATCCLPVVGPFIARSNLKESLTSLRCFDAALRVPSIQNAPELRTNYISQKITEIKKARLYSLCGMVGSMLTIALAVSLLAQSGLLVGICACFVANTLFEANRFLTLAKDWKLTKAALHHPAG